ncbi:HTH_Tnp_Tc3_2 domain-containing protein [Trichonephila clavipes]|nr:HTH_Tnp_Tc3_2 domain-containing protein [Trichonephila clavipes]
MDIKHTEYKSLSDNNSIDLSETAIMLLLSRPVLAIVPPRIIQERDQRRLTRINKQDRRATLPQIAADFNAGSSTSVTARTIQRSIINMSFQSRRPTRVPLLTARHKALGLAWAR